MTMSDQEFGRFCGVLISLALHGNAADMRQCFEHITQLVALRKLAKKGIYRDE